jgi:hypothetical protein
LKLHSKEKINIAASMNDAINTVYIAAGKMSVAEHISSLINENLLKKTITALQDLRDHTLEGKYGQLEFRTEAKEIIEPLQNSKFAHDQKTAEKLTEFLLSDVQEQLKAAQASQSASAGALKRMDSTKEINETIRPGFADQERNNTGYKPDLGRGSKT